MLISLDSGFFGLGAFYEGRSRGRIYILKQKGVSH